MELNIERLKPPYFPFSDEPAPKILFVQHYNMLCDPRTLEWERAISSVVDENTTVFDLGAGTGILSMIAAKKAKKVISVELDPHLARFAEYTINRNGFSDKIKLICCDARQACMNEKADVLICEMLDTGLIKEPIVPVLNEIRQNLIHDKTTIIPGKVMTKAVLSHTDFNFCGLEIPLPHFETEEVRKTTELFSEPILYHEISLYQDNPLKVDAQISIPVVKPGTANSVKIITETELLPGIICPPSMWFNPPLVLPIEPVKVDAGDVLKLHISYHLGEGLRTLDYEVIA
ncbi:MAG: 50S ribosomal protein L11 methyltransferase [Firmicutes bacterium]|nr:50S ribosomal protein L11 methyltransferase [Bacillota bacterium]